MGEISPLSMPPRLNFSDIIAMAPPHPEMGVSKREITHVDDSRLPAHTRNYCIRVPSLRLETLKRVCEGRTGLGDFRMGQETVWFSENERIKRSGS